MRKRIPLIIVVCILFCVSVFVLIYTRPQTIEQRYPELDLSECIGLSGYYCYSGVETTQSFSISPDDEQFEEMISLFRQASFRTRLRSILPRGTKSHRGEGFQWDVYFKFENIPMKDGSSISGDVLYVNNFYGDIELSFDGDMVQCSIRDSDQWLEAIFKIAESYAD